MMVEAMQNPFVDIVVHPGNPEYPVDEETIVKAAARYDVALEVNNSSLTVSRKGSLPHCDHIVSLAKTYGAKLIVGSDSHYCETVGEFSVAAELLAKHGLKPTEVDHYFFTQININTIFETMDRLQVPREKAATIMHHYGYTGSACLPMAFGQWMDAGKVKKGQIVAFIGSGGGLAFGVSLYKM